MALNAQINLSIIAQETSAGDISRTMRATPVSYSVGLTDGTGANQAQIAWSDSRTISGTEETLSLASLPDVRDGASVTVGMTSVNVLYVKNTHATATVLLGSTSAGTFAASHFVGMPANKIPAGAQGYALPPGAAILISVPTQLGLTTLAGQQFTVGSSTAGATYDIVIVGRGSVS
jgi:hypothetical protein